MCSSSTLLSFQVKLGDLLTGLGSGALLDPHKSVLGKPYFDRSSIGGCWRTSNDSSMRQLFCVSSCILLSRAMESPCRHRMPNWKRIPAGRCSMVYGTSTVFNPAWEGRIASDVEKAPLHADWDRYLAGPAIE